MTKIKIGLVQINNSFAGQNYIPYSVGIIQAYVQKYICNKDAFEFLLPIYKRIPIEIATKILLDADIIIFSVYTWNIKISLEIAKRIKEKKLDSLIIFGGPQIPNKSEKFLREYKFIDIACRGEGERTILFILNNYTANGIDPRSWKEIPSISYIDKGNFFQNKLQNRIYDLDKIPSPFIEGTFEPLIRANPDERWIVLWETNRGCPFSCSYCVWGAETQKKIYAYNIEKIYREIDWFSRHKIDFIFCCDANFGILQRDVDIIKYIIENKKKYRYPKVLSVQNAKNSTMRIFGMYKLMSGNGLSKGVSLALQSVNKDTLKYIRRENISINTFQELQKKFNEEHIETFTDMILGLPCETYKTFTDGISKTIENGQHNRIQFINLSILTNSEMDNIEYHKKFGFDIIETRLINIHGSLDIDEITETQLLVIGTKSMPREDWIKTRVFSWMTSLLHFDKLLQIPFIILNNKYSIGYCELIENFIIDNTLINDTMHNHDIANETFDKKFPILSEISSFFIEKAMDIQNGGAEYCESREWLNVWWPADELVMIKLCTENKLYKFYQEAEQLIIEMLDKKKVVDYRPILHEAIILNQNMIKVPFQDKDINLELSHDIYDYYLRILNGQTSEITKGTYHYVINSTNKKWLSWEDWCRDVVWYESKKGSYLYGIIKI